MDAWLTGWMEPQSLIVLFIIIGVCLAVLGRSAGLLVDEAVTLSLHWGIPKMLVGATIVSLGTTLPEASVSVLAAVQGNPDLALGNAVGSIICDTGLILGIAVLITPLRLVKNIVNRHGWIQVGAGFLLVAACVPWSHPGAAFTEGGNLPRWMGFVFLILLAGYIWLSLAWTKGGAEELAHHELHEDPGSTSKVFVKLIAGIALVVLSSKILIPAVEISALRLHVPAGIVAATLVAFGTSLPELVTSVTAARKGHGELAVGNIIGADILNVLFVAGAAAAATAGGLVAPAHFFRFLFPAMLIILIVFRIGIFMASTHLKRPIGVILIGIYVAITAISYIKGIQPH